MGIRTGIIKFNVKQRGRVFRGVDRAFDTVSLARVLNGREVQEQVKNGDCVGYYGHWPRVKFGLAVQEAAIVAGRVVNLEPAVRTVSIKGYDNGDVEHEIEFLDTAPGRLAQRLWTGKTGGFSSAINAPRRGSQQVATSFHGFDYVLEPNYTANRGYTLDSAGQRIEHDDLSEEDSLLLDDVAQYTGLVDATTVMLDRVQGDYDRQADVLMLIQEENVTYQGEIARMQAVLDSVKAELAAAQAAVVVEAPVPAPVQAAAPAAPAAPTRAEVLDAVGQTAIPGSTSRYSQADAFHGAPLVAFEQDGAEERKPEATDDYNARRWGVR